MSWSGYIPGAMLRDATPEQIAILMGGNPVSKDKNFYQAAYEIGEAQSWADWHEKGSAYRYTADEKVIAGLGTVKVIDRTEDSRGDADDHFYGEYGQGSEGELTVTFEVKFSSGDLRHFRKYGVADSYGRVEWTGRFVEVAPIEKTVTVFSEV